MSYLTRIDELRRAELQQRAAQFAATYDPNLPSVVLLPGGMGSRLLRSRAPYDPAATSGNVEFYELWLGLGPLLLGELTCLTMNDRTEERDQHPVIARGELSTLVKAYDGVFQYFAGKANVVGLGYDWRRAPDEECGYVRAFLQFIADEVKRRNDKWADPRRRLTLYAHSQGGLVAKLFVDELLASREEPADWFERLVTCCTPFYGTYTHHPRYYIGETLVNGFAGGADNVAGIIASLVGPYILLPAPLGVLEPRLGDLQMARYPVRDFDNDDIACDPYDGASAVAGRYRPEVSRRFLVAAKEQFKLIDRALPDAVADRVYHIRSDIFGDAGGGPGLELRWKAVDGASYDSGEGNPISDNTESGGRGDGTVPFWSARLASTPAANIFDVMGVKHGGAAEHRTVLDILWNLMQGVSVGPGPHVAPDDFSYASAHRVAEIGRDLRTAPDPDGLLANLPAGEYRAFVDSLRLA
jgi:hypothetical protein